MTASLTRAGWMWILAWGRVELAVGKQTWGGKQMTNRQLAILGMVGGALAIAGSLLPWATVTSAFGGASVNGIEGDGKFSLGLGAVIALAAFIRYGGGSARLPLVIAVLGILTLLLGVMTYMNVSERVEAASIRSSVGVGIYLVILGGVAALLSGQRGKQETAPPA